MSTPCAQPVGLRWVLLRHEVPRPAGVSGVSGKSGVDWHFDWMIERVAGGGLLTFRVMVRVDEVGVTEFVATKLVDHRAVYLEYEGEISGGRGTVSRVVSGTVVNVVEGAGEIAIDLDIGRFVGTVVRGDEWRFMRV